MSNTSSDSKRRTSWIGWIRAALVLAGLGHAGVFLFVAGLRRSYPFELEWMEGGVLEHVRRVLDGKPIYVPPSLEFTPFLYAPLYYYASAALATFRGLSFAILRDLSWIMTVGSAAWVFDLARFTSGSKFAGVLAVGCFAATYLPTGAWFDLARADAMFLFFLLASISVFIRERGPREDAGAALLMVMAVMTKQTAIGMAAGLSLYALCFRRGAARWVFPAVTALGLGASWVALNRDGWFAYYAFGLPRSFAWGQDMRWSFWSVDLLPMGVLFGFAAIGVVQGIRRGGRLPALVFLGLLLTSWHARNHLGASTNALIPACTAAAIFAAGFVAKLGEPGGSRAMAATLLLLGQLVFLFRPVGSLIPTVEDRNAGERLVGLFRQVPGEIFAPAFGYMVARAGKAPQAHMMAIADVMRDPAHPEYGRKLQEEIEATLSMRRYDLVVLNTPWLLEQIHPGYADRGTVFADPKAFFPVVGTRTRPDRWFVKKSAP